MFYLEDFEELQELERQSLLLRSVESQERSGCSFIQVKNWSPAYDFISDRPMAPISGKYCEIHCTNPGPGEHCRGAVLAVVRKMQLSN